MGFKSLINKFTAGELDPKFLGEVDYEGYRKGARKLRNVLCTPQGAGQRRFGTEFNVQVSNSLGPIIDPEKVRIIGFEYLSDEIYWLVLKEEAGNTVALDIYLDTNLMTSINPLGTYTADQIPDIRWLEDVNKIFFFHEARPTLLVQRASAASWAAANAVFSFYPAEDFAPLDSPTNNYTNNGTTFTPNAVNATTITASTAVFTSNHAGLPPNGGGLYIGHEGIFRIVSVNAAGTVATGYSLNDFADTSAIKGSESFLDERAWGDGIVIGGAPPGIARGYPRHGNFFQGRLCLGGTPSSPGSTYASEPKDYFDFSNSDNAASSGWIVEAGVTGTDVIQDIMSTKSLVVLTTKGPSATSILLDLPTTPTNVFMNTQGQESSRNMDGVVLNNQILYADRSGNTIWGMIYDVPDSGYSIFNSSILSSHLIRNPQWADVFDPEAVEGRYYLLINEDGTMAMLNSILEENIKAWTLAQTTGSFVDVACVANQAKVLVRRKIGTDTTVNGSLNAAYTVDDTFTVFTNVTTAVNNMVAQVVMLENEDYILIGNEIPFTRMAFTFFQPSSNNMALSFEFLTNTGAWETFSPTDGTTGFMINGEVSWNITDVSNWLAQPIVETDTIYDDYPSYYWLRIQRNNATNPASSVFIDTLFLNTTNSIYLERLTFDNYMDSQIDAASDSLGLITGLNHLVGQNVFVFANGFPIGTKYVNAAGEVTIDTVDADVQVGLDYTTMIVPMPVVALLQNGYDVYDPKHIKTIFIDFYKSLGLTVQGQNFPNVVPGLYLSQIPPEVQSGFEEIPAFSGWDPRADIVISQSYPAPMIIRGISYEVEIG